MSLTKKVKTDMKRAAEKLGRLDEINQIIIISKIDALFDRQMLDEGIHGKKNVVPPQDTA